MPATVAVMLMTEKPPRIVEGVVLEQAGEQLELMLPEGTSMPTSERTKLGEWLACGAP